MGAKSLLIVTHFRILIWKRGISFLPLNKGQHCPIAPITPRPVNWPIESSMNSNGMPQMNNVMKYGSRKTPERIEKEKRSQFISI